MWVVLGFHFHMLRTPFEEGNVWSWYLVDVVTTVLTDCCIFLLFSEGNILLSIVYLLREMMMEAFISAYYYPKIKLVQIMRKSRLKIIQLGKMCHISLENSNRTRNMTNATFYGRKLGEKTLHWHCSVKKQFEQDKPTKRNWTTQQQNLLTKTSMIVYGNNQKHVGTTTKEQPITW